jgi:hypothetical protein
MRARLPSLVMVAIESVGRAARSRTGLRMEGQMRDRQDDLRSLTDDIKADAGRVHDIEDEAGRQDPGSQRFRDLSAESERLARGMAVKTSAKRELADELQDENETGEAGRSPSSDPGRVQTA